MGTNTNCLKGLRCPHCCSYGPFTIIVECLAIVSDEGVEDYTDPEWNFESCCSCRECDFTGNVEDFEKVG
jgi:hypothetical protein